MPRTWLIPLSLSASWGFLELTQTVCCLFTLFLSFPLKCKIWEMHILCVASCFLLCPVVFSKSEFYSCHLLPVCECIYVHKIISCGSDMGFGCVRRACEHADLLCRAGCSSTAAAQWFKQTLCMQWACITAFLCERVLHCARCAWKCLPNKRNHRNSAQFV